MLHETLERPILAGLMKCEPDANIIGRHPSLLSTSARSRRLDFAGWLIKRGMVPPRSRIFSRDLGTETLKT